MGSALAQEVPTDASRRLQALEQELQKTRSEREDSKRKAREISDELGRIRAEMVAAARAAQESEEVLSELEGQLSDLSSQEGDRREILRRRSEQMTGVLMALQRLARRPTEALIAQPQTPANTVRSAILMGAAIPQIQQSVGDLRGEVDMVGRLRNDVIEQKKRIASTTTRLLEEHERLKKLWERKFSLQSAAIAESEEAERRMSRLAEEAGDLRELMTRLEGERLRRLAEEAAKIAAEKAAREAEVIARKNAREAEIAAEKAAREAEIAARKAEKERQTREVAEAAAARKAEQRAQAQAREKELAAQQALRTVEAAAAAAAAAQTPKAEHPFSLSQGRMPFPARGQVTARFGQPNDVGVAGKGISIATRQGAQVVAPYDGLVAFSGPFRGYGLLLIIEHGEGYHTLLAGMSRIDATVGQRLLAGEPVGIMDPDTSQPLLYVELRHNGQPINPLPWLTAQKSKVNG